MSVARARIETTGLPRQQQLPGSVTDYEGVDMPNAMYCPIPMPDGSDCWRSPEPDGYAGICTEHMREIAQAWVGDPAIRRFRCAQCGHLGIVRDRTFRLSVCPNCEQVTVLESPDLSERCLGTKEPRADVPKYFARRTDVIYYLRFGDRIKIGTSSNLPKRLQSLPVDELLAVELGDVTAEKRRHAQFRSALVAGQQEWFHDSPELVAHINSLRALNGPPMAAWRRWYRGRTAA